MRVLLTGGGTAGHINPALAIAETVRRNRPDAEILFVGIKGGKEDDLVGREGYDLKHVRSMGLSRSLSPKNIKALWLALCSPYLKETTHILDTFRPDIVIGTGGYACWPIMAAAARRGIPTALHESNAMPGVAIKQLQGRVDRIWINFEDTRRYLKAQKKVYRVGNPIRGAFGTVSKESARQRLGIAANEFFVLSFGGSLGAEHVNEAMLVTMKALAESFPQMRFLHASGKRDYANCRARFDALGLNQLSNCTLSDYIYDMPLQMTAADLIVCRAGAMTLSEIALMKKAAILIPSPYVAANHQYYNAKALADAGAAILVEEASLPSEVLTQTVRELAEDSERIKAMEERIGAFSAEDANHVIWKQILEMVKQLEADFGNG